MQTADSMTEFMDSSPAEFFIGSAVVEPAVVHGRVRLRNVSCGGADVRPRSAFVEGDADIRIALEIPGEEVEG